MTKSARLDIRKRVLDVYKMHALKNLWGCERLAAQHRIYMKRKRLWQESMDCDSAFDSSIQDIDLMLAEHCPEAHALIKWRLASRAEIFDAEEIKGRGTPSCDLIAETEFYKVWRDMIRMNEDNARCWVKIEVKSGPHSNDFHVAALWQAS